MVYGVCVYSLQRRAPEIVGVEKWYKALILFLVLLLYGLVAVSIAWVVTLCLSGFIKFLFESHTPLINMISLIGEFCVPVTGICISAGQFLLPVYLISFPFKVLNVYQYWVVLR